MKPAHSHPRPATTAARWLLAWLSPVLLAACADDITAGPTGADLGTDARPSDAGAAHRGPTEPDAAEDAAARDAAAQDDGDAIALPDGATPQGCPSGPGCPCKTLADCDDGDPCTAGDRCSEGRCGVPEPTNCDDGNACTEDFCTLADACTVTELSGTPCNDGDSCTILDACVGGGCEGGKARDCSDGKVCTDDKCFSPGGCTFVHNTVQCRKENACVKASFCSFGICPWSQFKKCEDSEPCTYDFCTPELGCEHLARPAPVHTCDGTTRWGRCWRAHKTAPLTWAAARKLCQQWGGEPVSIHDTYENALVRKLADQACDADQGAWIGLSDAAREGTWQFSDTTVYGFRAWKKGEPNNAGDEDYAEMIDGGGWNDVGAKLTRGCVVCAKPMISRCSDGDGCTAGDACAMAQCVTGTAITDCDDHNPCTADSCTAGAGCGHLASEEGTSCGEGMCSQGACRWSPAQVFGSCKEAAAKLPGAPNGVYTLAGTAANGKAMTYPAWCEMEGPDGGGWTLVMQSDGKSGTLAWDSKLWTDKKTLEASAAPWAAGDAKLPAYWNVPGQELLVRMTTGETAKIVRSLTIPLGGKALYAVIAPGKLVPTALDYHDWKQLVPGSTLQQFCHKQGFNVWIKGAGRARIGIIGNNENQCASPDSWLGVGGYAKMCGNKVVKSTGNIGCYWADNGTRRIASFARLLVR